MACSKSLIFTQITGSSMTSSARQSFTLNVANPGHAFNLTISAPPQLFHSWSSATHSISPCILKNSKSHVFFLFLFFSRESGWSVATHITIRGGTLRFEFDSVQLWSVGLWLILFRHIRCFFLSLRQNWLWLHVYIFYKSFLHFSLDKMYISIMTTLGMNQHLLVSMKCA